MRCLRTENIREILSADPWSIKQDLIAVVDKNLGTKNPSLYESGFLGYLTQALTLLTSDTMFNNFMAWNEAFTHLLTLNTSLNNHADMLDYNLQRSAPCTGFVSVYVPFSDNGQPYQLTLKNGTACKGTPQYLVKNTYMITVSLTNSKVQVKNALTGVVSDIEYNIEVRNGNRYLVFNAEVWQVRLFRYNTEFIGVVYKEFYDVNLTGLDGQFYDINIGVYVEEDNLTSPRLYKFNRIDRIYSAGSKDKVFTFKYFNDGKATIRFGNSIFGYQPKEGTSADIVIYTSEGANGAAHPGQIELSEKLVDFYSSTNVEVYGTNLASINNGANEESLERAKQNIIDHTNAARRLVTQNDYVGFEGVTGLKNMEFYPMLLRRDTNVNEIDFFAVLYDQAGKPIPTTNINYIINSNRKILSKDFVYKLALRYGENAIELVPNVPRLICPFSYFDPNNPPSTEKIAIAAMYIDSEYERYNSNFEDHDGKIIMCFSDNTEEYYDPDEVKELVCPFNLSIENIENSKVGKFEYIPKYIKDTPIVEDQLDYVDIDISIASLLMTVLPSDALKFTNINPTHINFITSLVISSTTTPDKIRVNMILRKSGFADIVYNCEHKYINTENNEMNVNCIIPMNEIFVGDFQLDTEIWYGNKYYNTYTKYINLVDDLSLAINKSYIDSPLSYSYNINDSSSMQPEPAIDKVYVGVSGVSVEWSNWEDEDGFPVEGYLVDVNISKLEAVDINKIKCILAVNNSHNNYQMNSVGITNNISAVYRFKVPYNPNYIKDGNTYYQIKILYKFKNDDGSEGTTFSPFKTYSGYMIFRKTFSQLMWCNIEKLDLYNEELIAGYEGYSKYNLFDTYYENDGISKVYKIPVVEKSYYEKNSQYLENDIFYKLAQLDSNLMNYKMLTDRLNFKFAKTFGTTENLKYNDNIINIDPVLKYHGWGCDLPPTIKVRILIDKKTSRTKNDIINECKQVILSFLQIRAGFNTKIIMSEVARYVHSTIPDIVSCTILSPKKDILYLYTEEEFPKDKDTILSFAPEFIWIDIDKIKIEAIITP